MPKRVTLAPVSLVFSFLFSGFCFLFSDFCFLHAQTAASPGRVEVLRAVGGLPPEICGLYREPIAFQQTASGVYYVFDRRGHSVHSIGPDRAASRKVVDIGSEKGRVLEPSAFDLGPGGTFVVSDAPNGRERLQIFDFDGTWMSGFTLPGRAQPRIAVGGVALSGVGTLALRGDLIALNQPETGALIAEYSRSGIPVRSIGRLRATGHEADRELHLAMNAGIPLPHPDGGYFFVFLAGMPVFRRYDAKGTLLFERVMQGRELDAVIEDMPKTWPRRPVEGMELPLVPPTVRTARVDNSGNLWISFMIPFTYVFNTDGEKIRTVQFRGAGVVTPTSLFFTRDGRLLVTPGCYAFPER
jgi:hypothetical protein